MSEGERQYGIIQQLLLLLNKGTIWTKITKDIVIDHIMGFHIQYFCGIYLRKCRSIKVRVHRYK